MNRAVRVTENMVVAIGKQSGDEFNPTELIWEVITNEMTTWSQNPIDLFETGRFVTTLLPYVFQNTYRKDSIEDLILKRKCYRILAIALYEF